MQRASGDQYPHVANITIMYCLITSQQTSSEFSETEPSVFLKEYFMGHNMQCLNIDNYIEIFSKNFLNGKFAEGKLLKYEVICSSETCLCYGVH